MTIRPERPGEEEAIADVVRAAFSSELEVRLVAALRRSNVFIPELSLVAEADGVLAGHVMITYAELEDPATGNRRLVASLAPLAVAPSFQRQGIGSALVRAAAAGAEAHGEPLLVLQGDPAYYDRLGFEPASAYGIGMPLPDWAPPEAAQVLRLSRYDASWRGVVNYPPPFDEVAEH